MDKMLTVVKVSVAEFVC